MKANITSVFRWRNGLSSSSRHDTFALYAQISRTNTQQLFDNTQIIIIATVITHI